MTKSPTKKPGQHDYVQTVIRIPPALSAEVRAAAELHGRSMNAEIIARLQGDHMDAIMARLDRLERMMQMVIDRG